MVHGYLEIQRLINDEKYDEAMNLLKNTKQSLQTILYLTRIHRLCGRFEKAIQLGEKLVANKDNLQMYIEGCLEIASTYFLQGESDKAHKYLVGLDDLIQNLVLDDEKELLRIIGNYYHQLANVRLYWDDFETTEQRLFKAIEIRKKADDLKNLALSYNNLAVLYKYNQKIGKSILYFSESIKISKQINNKYGQAISLSNLIDIYHTQGNVQQAKIHLDLLKSLHEVQPDNIHIEFFYKYNLGVLHVNKNTFEDLSIAKKIFNTIIHSQIILFQLSIKSIYRLYDIYLFEMKVMDNPRYLDELQELIDISFSIALKQKSITKIIEATFLELIYEILIRDEQKVYDTRRRLEELIGSLGNDIRKSIYNVELTDLFLWEEKILSSDITTSEQLFYINFKRLFSNFIIPNLSSVLETEVPVLLSIMGPKEQLLFEKIFDTEKVSKFMMKKFRAAIQTLVISSRNSANLLEKIKVNKYIVNLKEISSVTFVYIYSGMSKTAHMRIDQVHFDLYLELESMEKDNDWVMTAERIKAFNKSIELVFHKYLV